MAGWRRRDSEGEKNWSAFQRRERAREMGQSVKVKEGGGGDSGEIEGLSFGETHAI